LIKRAFSVEHQALKPSIRNQERLLMDFYNQNGENLGSIEFSSDILEAPVNEAVLHQVVVAQLANKRRGTASTKSRSEVRGSGRKIFRQKGTGLARAGERRSPIRIGGGVTFGPKPRDYGRKVSKKVKRLAIKSVLADKFQNDNVIIVDDINLEYPKTKQMVNIMEKLGFSKDDKVLILLDSLDVNVFHSVRNIPRVSVCVWDNINTYDILLHDKLLITRDALEKIEERWT
jgi:large subunit ribosomal protein L4